MENHSNPSPIKEYYIAYFDILGYREFFNELIKNNQLEKVETFLSDIHCAIDNVKHKLSSISNNKLLDNVENADFDFKIKIFSDNFIICLERHKETYLEKARALTFLEVISEIQRNFIIVHNLFVRGGVTIGRVSFNKDYVFGKGVIDAVELEEKTVYPRIAIDKSFFDFVVTPMTYTPEELEKAKNIENMLNRGEKVSKEDNDFYSRLLSSSLPEIRLVSTFGNMVYLSGDRIQCLSYLYKINPNDYMDSKSISDVIAAVKELSPDVADELSKSMLNFSNDISEMLRVHKIQIEGQIQKYGNYNDIDQNNLNDAIQRERVLKKYAWAMKYHNQMCDKYQKTEYIINSIANCDARFMTLMINIVELPLITGNQTSYELKESSNNE